MDYRQLLIEAAKENKIAVVDKLLSVGVSADTRDADGYTSLYWACCRGHTEICHRLLLKGCDVNAKGNCGATPLMACADNGRTTCLASLLQHRSLHLDAQNDRGDSALHMAAYRGFSDITSLLCQAGAATTLFNKNNNQPLGEALIMDRTECIRILNEIANYNVQSPNAHQSHYNTPNKGQDPRENRRHILRPSYSVSEDEVVDFPSCDSAMALSLDSYSSAGSMHITSTLPKSVDGRDNMSPRDTMVKQKTGNRSTDVIYNITPDSPSFHSTSRECGHKQLNISGPEIQDSGLESISPLSSFCSNPQDTHTHISSISSTSPHLNSTGSDMCSFHFPNTSSSSRVHSNENFHRLSAVYSSCADVKNDHSPSNAYIRQNSPYSTSSHQANNLSYPSSQRETLNDSRYLEHSLNVPKTKGNMQNCDESKSDSCGDLPLSNVSKRVQNSDKNYQPSSSEMLPGLKTASFVESLQMRMISLEETLRQERVAKNEMRKEKNRLKDENLKLRAMLKDLSSRSSDPSQRVARKS